MGETFKVADGEVGRGTTVIVIRDGRKVFTGRVMGQCEDDGRLILSSTDDDETTEEFPPSECWSRPWASRPAEAPPPKPREPDVDRIIVEHHPEQGIWRAYVDATGEPEAFGRTRSAALAQLFRLYIARWGAATIDEPPLTEAEEADLEVG